MIQRIRTVLGRIAVVALIVTAACAQSAPEPQVSVGERPNAGQSAPPDAQLCSSQGGEVRRVCMLGRQMCVVPYPDAGKTCSDSSECGGRCLYDGDAVQPGTPVTGYCQKDNDPCGCFSEVEDGKLGGGLCID